MDLKQLLKNLKLNESTVSVLLGGIVIILVAVLFISQTRQLSDENKIELGATIPEVSNDIEAPSTEEIEDNEDTFIVAQGDTFWSIAEQEYGSGFEWVKIAQANPDINPLTISEGDVLKLPAGGEITEEAVATEQYETTTTMEQTQSEHVVEQGDSLWSISVAIYGDGYRWSEISELNNLVNPNIIHPGNILQLPHS